MATISICMIVKNEEKVLARCLDSVCGLAEEIIIVDTGSNDRTKEIARRYTDKVYDFMWNNDFSEARNYSFSKATMEYIFCVDADEVMDGRNQEAFLKMKAVLLPEIDIVQMWYVNDMERTATENYEKEYRPKLYKRLRTFRWQDPIHESVCLEPVVYDSEIEILHMPEGVHGHRDFRMFQLALQRGERLSKKLHNMYARELMIAGKKADFCDAEPFFLESYGDESRSLDEKKEAACVLAKHYRMQKNTDAFFKYALKDMITQPCSEMCLEIGRYYREREDYEEACVWFYNAAYETESILDIRCSGILPLTEIAESYERWAAKIVQQNKILAEEFCKMAKKYQEEAKNCTNSSASESLQGI